MKIFNYGNGVWIVLILVIMLASISDWTDAKVVYQFKQHYYRRKPKVEKKFKSARKVCLDTYDCKNSYDLELIKCWRQCMAPSCYQELYAEDELEHGEIDIRAAEGQFVKNSGCINACVVEKDVDCTYCPCNRESGRVISKWK